ncbi:hypothetical protein ACQ86N_03795 [Puia sp. P3]|uniref:hypothetical protein n=1 Tax=Puia sp. P3 TaxID=3423952 RepID=UPI003D673485
MRDVDDRPISNIGQGLQGVIPNLNITFSDGHPGATANLNVRGFTSINRGSPWSSSTECPATSTISTRRT